MNASGHITYLTLRNRVSMTPLKEKIMQMYMVHEKWAIFEPRRMLGMRSSGTCIAVTSLRPIFVGYLATEYVSIANIYIDNMHPAEYVRVLRR